MAIEDVKNYYNSVCEDYHELLQTLKDMEEEYNKNLVSPETLENLKKQIEPIKINYQTISYIIFLLNRPKKKAKIRKYERQHNKNIGTYKTLEDVKKENRNILNNISK